MKVTYNWLKDFVDIRIPARELADRLTMSGLEVVSLEKSDGDFVFEMEITPNRPDCLSVIGIAREVSAITSKKLKLDSRNLQLATRENKKRVSRIEHPRLEIKIENKVDCPLYIARVIRGVEVGPSPEWLRLRLEMVGLRCINNIVDITNYVLMETGQPLHAFDMDRITGDTVFVRRARDSENIVTIDGEKKNLNKDTLIIADKVNPIAIAGIMGGQHSEVNQSTRDILLEAAVFDPVVTRRGSRALGLSSDSSYRFERGVDKDNVDLASWRAADLILELAGGNCILTKATTKPKRQRKTITINTERLNRILGVGYSQKQIKKALTSLCFLVKQHGKGLRVELPSFRTDVNQQEDLVEEVARIVGYDKIPTRLPSIISQIEISGDWTNRRRIRDILVSQGLNEAITYSLISKNQAECFGYSGARIVTIANPLSNQQEALRPTLLPGLISCIGYNLNQKQQDVRIFEIGDIFKNDRRREYPALALAVCASGEKASAKGRESEKMILYLTGVLEILLNRLGIANYEFNKSEFEHPYFHKTANVSLMINGRHCASLGMIRPEILARFDIKDYIFAAVLDLEILFAEIDKVQRRYTPIPLFPKVMRDISIIIQQDIPYGDVKKSIVKNKVSYLIKVNLKDRYEGKQIPPGFKGLTLSCIYRANDRTLTAQEIDAAHQKVLDILKTEFSAQLR